MGHSNPFASLNYQAALKAMTRRKAWARTLITPAIRKQVKQLVRSGKNNLEIMELVGISQQSVISIKRLYGLQRHKRH